MPASTNVHFVCGQKKHYINSAQHYHHSWGWSHIPLKFDCIYYTEHIQEYSPILKSDTCTLPVWLYYKNYSVRKTLSGYSSFSALVHLLNKYTSCCHDGWRSYTIAMSTFSFLCTCLNFLVLFMYMFYFCSSIAGCHKDYKYCTLEQLIF